MRKRYVVTSRNKPRLYRYDDEQVMLCGTTVREAEPQVIETGLLDASGNPIFSIEAMGRLALSIIQTNKATTCEERHNVH